MEGNNVIEWLLGEDNPAVRYRTQTEILGRQGDKAAVKKWLGDFWTEDKSQKGLWSTYYLTAFAESGLLWEDIPLKKEKIVGFQDGFDCGCESFMRLNAVVRLGLGHEPAIMEIIGNLKKKQLPDGGFLCHGRFEKLDYIPKSCVKANMYALMFCAECRKKGIKTDIEESLIDYFWAHNLFYRTDNPKELMLDVRKGWRATDIFYPFEVMRVGLQNIIESLCALGYGGDEMLAEAWKMLDGKKDSSGKYILEGTLSKSYLPKERAGRPSKWATFYALLAKKESGIDFQN